jgi:hypothetical protein
MLLLQESFQIEIKLSCFSYNKTMREQKENKMQVYKYKSYDEYVKWQKHANRKKNKNV